jgi:Bacterial TniB protein
VRPVVYVPLPPEFTVRDMQDQVLAAIGAVSRGWQGGNRDLLIKWLAKDLNVRMFMFDDIQHFTNQSPVRAGKLFDWIKYLLVDLEITVVVAGIPSVAEALHSDSQISTRFDPLTMPAWDVNEALAQFLGNFGRTFPLREPSNLEEPQMQPRADWARRIMRYAHPKRQSSSGADSG